MFTNIYKTGESTRSNDALKHRVVVRSLIGSLRNPRASVRNILAATDFCDMGGND
jgi:hypothetical protein